MNRVVLMLSLVLAACAGDAGSTDPGDAGTSGDAGPGCDLGLSYDPNQPYADPVATIRVQTSVVHIPGVLTYQWSVTRNNSTVTYTNEASDGSQIGFIAPLAGIYRVSVTISGLSGCNFAEANINVLDPAGAITNYRLRTVAPTGPSGPAAPPQETIIQVHGGGDFDRPIPLDPGVIAQGTIRNGSAGPGIPAYVKFMPNVAPNALTETFTTGAGGYSVRLLNVLHDVLIIPTSTGLAPKRVTTWMPGQTTLVVGPGTVVTGTVRAPSGNGFGGVKVQLSSTGIPSTIGTTLADGTFSVRTDFPANATVTVKVTPPAASGLPRLEASAMFTLTSAFQISYGSTLATCDIGGTVVRRGGNAQAGAKVTVVGALNGIGTITAGASATANGTVRVPVTANGSGIVPASTLVPRGALSAVVDVGTNDYAVDQTFDTSTCPSQIIDAPAMTARTGTTQNLTAQPLGNILVEATPVGALALAEAMPIAVTASSAGAFSISLATGGYYDVRFIDPQSRVAPLVLLGINAAGVPTTATLPKALVISGKVSVIGNANPVVGASVQLLCATCTGIDATRPVVQTATDSLSKYRLAVRDPGTM